MRKLALLLGSLVVVASASAKEVVPAPVVVEEAPVQIVEKEVIVYRDKEEGFRPNGNVDLQYRYYGRTEKNNGESPKDWNGANNYSRLQLSGAVQMTEAQKLEFRVREFNDLDKESPDEDGKGGLQHGAKDTQVRLRYFYNHGNLGDSKVNLTSRVEHHDKGDNQSLEYQARFNFAEYMFNNDFIKTTDFTVAPKYAYWWSDDNSSNYDSQVGADLYTFHELPWGFSTEFNVYATQHFYGQDQYFDGATKKEDKNFTVDIEAYLYHTLPLYTNGNLSIALNSEGGYDAYNWSKEKQFGHEEKVNALPEYKGEGVGTENAQYSVYFTSAVQADYQATPNVKLYAAAGAEYRNWQITSENSASNWRWQPTAWAGFKTTF
ncbi:MAG: hypothetical protein Q4B33_07540 [Fusobacterium sp.]|nr:hypothetical protein [Fusobacterium sp.]